MAMHLSVHKNTAEARERLGYDRRAAVGDTTAKYFIHNSQSGLFIFTMHEPKLDDRITDEYAKTVCKIGQGNDCCRYLTLDVPMGWSCEKFGYFRARLDQRVWSTQMGVAGEDSIVAQGDNCEGRAP